MLRFWTGHDSPLVITGEIINTFRPRQNGRHFTDDIFKCIFFKENAWIYIEISLMVVPTGPINNVPALIQIVAWRRPGDKPLSEQMLVSLSMYICVTWPQWVNETKIIFKRFQNKPINAIWNGPMSMAEQNYMSLLYRTSLTHEVPERKQPCALLNSTMSDLDHSFQMTHCQN